MDESALPENTLVVAGITLAAILVFAYATLVAGQFLVVVWFALTGVTLWFLYRFVVAVERIADAQQRLADAESAGATGSTDPRSGPTTGDD
jgi:membrane protein implicated in regulation of membrane protease activity